VPSPRSEVRTHRCSIAWPIALLALAAGAASADAQQPVLASDLPREGFIARTRSIDLNPVAGFDAGPYRVVVLIDDTDVTGILESTADGWRYDATLLPLPSGEHELVAWLIDDDATWREVLRETFRVPGAFGVEATTVEPTLDIGVKSRLASAFEPAVQGERDTYNDFDGQLGLDAGVVRHGGDRGALRAQLVGNSERNRALRFGELADEAPRVDLSSYVAQLRHRGVELSVGNVVAGGARHLIQGFNSRGGSLSLAAGSRLLVTAGAIHGSNVVGWDELLGVGEPDHRILTGSIAVEALQQPGALRVELTALDGSVLPRSGFDQGAITDAEASRGYALRLQSESLGRRLRLEGGFTRSRFDNPNDPALARDTVLVPVAAVTRDARYLQTSLDVVRSLRLGATRTARLTVGWAHERVDPLFRTVGSYVRADQLQHRWEVRGDIGGITISTNHARSRNNLDDIGSILTSHTRRTGLDLAVPLGNLLGGRDWLPALRWRTDRTHQFGAGVPVNGGFDESHVPDQVSTTHTLSADVRIGFAGLGYRYDVSRQDNRQPGRETADLERITNGFTAAITPLRTVSANIDVSWIDALNLERAETDRTRRLGLGLSWRPIGEAVLGVQLSDTHGENDVRMTAQDDRSWSVQIASPVPGLQRFGGRWLIRFARATNAARDGTGADLQRSNWMVDTGFNLSFR